MATLVVVTFKDKNETWLARPNNNDPKVVAMRQVVQAEHFLSNEVDIESFVAKVKEAAGEEDVTVRIFKEQLAVPTQRRERSLVP